MENLQLGNYYTNSTGAKLTNSSGISFVAFFAKASGLIGLLKGLNGTLKKHWRGATERERLFLQVYLLVTKEGHLWNLDDARQTPVFRLLMVEIPCFHCQNTVFLFLCGALGYNSSFTFHPYVGCSKTKAKVFLTISVSAVLQKMVISNFAGLRS